MVQTTTTSTDTNTTTTASQWQTYNHYRAEQGWECPRCGRINAPWVRQCDCSRSNWSPTWTIDRVTTGDKPEWWKDYVTCGQADDITKNPNIYQVGGSDYWNPTTKEWKNVDVSASNTQSKSVPDLAVNNFTTYRTDVPKTYTTETVVNDGIHNFYNLKTSKENK